ncbi:putative periplasmic ligand-binding sensor domain protein [Bernardetia litoralis DSM 6794]|uniref:Putative periplasmic ligand-binding sensor domain protein n=2 Tax=Bernardetia litoralis TaxID=999 RepID=I4AFG5_BERLS|nr:putative periplasmic ligand-binding sensor domain protein [Bernardetia litoralis DSM 6794]
MRYVFSITLFFLINFTFAQQNQNDKILKVEALNIQHGLSQSTVNDILEDRDGFVWIATDDGLNRYDGQKFTIYKHIRSDATTIPDNIVKKLHEDKNGKIWIGTVSGLCVYDKNTNQFKSYRNDDKNSNSLIDNYITALKEDKNFIWVGTQKGLSKFDTKKEIFTNYSVKEKDSLILGNNEITSLLIDNQNQLWIGTTKGLNVWTADRKPKDLFRYTVWKDSTTILGSRISSIYQDTKNRIWVGTTNCAHLYNPSSSNFQRFLLSNEEVYTVYKISETQNGEIWAASDDLIYKINPQSISVSIYTTSVNPIGNVQTMYSSKNGTMWIGTRDVGLIKYNPSANRFRLYKTEKGNKNSLVDRNIWAILKDSKGMVWVGTDEAISRINRNDTTSKNQISYYHFFKGNKNTDYQGKGAYSIVETDSGKMWFVVGTTIIRMDTLSKEKGGIFTSLLSKEDFNSVQSTLLYIHQDSKSTLWGASFNGIYQLIPVPITRENQLGYTTKAYLKGTEVWHVFEDSENILWLSTNKGLVKMIKNEQNEPTDFISYTSDPKDITSISSNTVRSITEDSKGNLWIGTNNGLNKMDKKTGTFEHWGERNELANYAIYGILADEKDNLWLSTNKGLFKFLNDEQSKSLADDRRIIVYDTRDGLQSLEFNTGAFYKAKDGELFFGGIEGLNSFYPKDIQANTEKRNVILTGLKVFGEKIKVNQEKEGRIVLPKALNNLEELNLTYEDKIITLEFVSPNFNKPEYDTYLYKLEGFDKEWNKTTTIKQATYTNLPAGNYTFRVKVINGDNIESEETTLKVSVSPPFWKSWWFISLCGLVVLGASIGFYKHRMKTVKIQNEKLEELVNQRTSQLKEKNEEVNQQNEEILQQNEQLEQQQRLVETAYQNVSLLSEVGKQITSNLSVEMIIEMVYDSVNKLLDASVFSIGIYNEDENTLDFINAKEKGETLPFHQTLLSNDNLPSYCFNQNAEMNIRDLQKEYNNYIPNQKLKVIEGEMPESLIYVPINYKNETIGVLTVQSFKKYTYDENHLSIIRNIAVYAAIALINAKSYQQITEQSEAITIQNKNITASINYASRIQRAMLPPIKEIKSSFDEAFVLWLPRDVVSGDFYWFTKIKDKTFIAAVDCTGHGVPGACMSMIGNDMLNHIVLGKEITDPSLILLHLHEQVSLVLRQSETQNQDGMDMALCVYDHTSKTMSFAGAKNPLYYIQNKKLNYIAGAKSPIGGRWSRNESDRIFKTHTIQINEPTTFFLCTDGYQDQFGGKKGKKLMKKTMKSLFAEIAEVKDDKQKEKLENYFFDWKKEEEQVDDVLVMGFKVGNSNNS